MSIFYISLLNDTLKGNQSTLKNYLDAAGLDIHREDKRKILKYMFNNWQVVEQLVENENGTNN